MGEDRASAVYMSVTVLVPKLLMYGGVSRNPFRLRTSQAGRGADFVACQVNLDPDSDSDSDFNLNCLTRA